MGTPWFQMKELARQHGILALSSNYSLYADLSSRMMAVLGTYSPDQEIYSIDECFLGMKGFTQALLDKAMLPTFLAHGVGKAFAVSLFTNVLFGPQMMAFHRLEDNLILGEKGFAGIERAWWTLLWFWVPAHTLTFSLPQEFQIGLAAFWGLVLGVILGLSKPAPRG